MKALLFDNERQLHLDENYPEPEIKPGEALIRVNRAGICNTDLEITRGYMAYQGVLGHEFVGVVVEVGSAADKSWIGRRVVGDINAACGECPTCRANRPTHCPNRTTLGISRLDGAFAEYLRLPVANLFAVPDSVPDEEAVFTEPLAAACEILQQYHLQPTEKVAIIGDGKLGLLISQVLRLTGADLTLVGRHPEKGEIVRRQGVRYEVVPAVEDLAGLREKLGECDLVVECTGNQAGLETAKQLVRPRGTIVLKSTYHGLPTVPLSLYVVDEVTMLGSRCGPFAPALRLLERGLIDVNALISAEFPLRQGEAAFEAAFGRGNIKVLLNMS
jgi:alcohol dehydrogenase